MEEMAISNNENCLEEGRTIMEVLGRAKKKTTTKRNNVGGIRWLGKSV